METLCLPHVAAAPKTDSDAAMMTGQSPQEIIRPGNAKVSYDTCLYTSDATT